MPAWSNSGESALADLLMVPFLLYPHMAGRERQMSSLVSLHMETLILLDQSPTLMTSINFTFIKHSEILVKLKTRVEDGRKKKITFLVDFVF